jgi:hypothetical protein
MGREEGNRFSLVFRDFNLRFKNMKRKRYRTVIDYNVYITFDNNGEVAQMFSPIKRYRYTIYHYQIQD